MLASRISKLIIDKSPRQLYYRLRQTFLVQEQLQEFDAEHPSVFVLSTGRVGTQTLAALFGLASNVFAYHEPSPILYGLSKLSYENTQNILASQILKEVFLTARRELLDYSLYCGRGYVESSPQTTFLAPVIREALPSARFIHLVRDPRHVLRSGIRRRWYAGHPADKTRIVPDPSSEAGTQWDSYNTFQKNLWLWTETNKWIIQFSESLLAERILLVHSEDLFNAHKPTIKQLFAFVGASIPSFRKIERVLGKKLNAQKKGTFPQPSDWSQAMNDDLLARAGETAKKLGYDLT